MNGFDFEIRGTTLRACPSGALFWPAPDLLCVSDLHFGKSDRIARRGGAMLPPYETRDTLARLEADIRATAPRTVVCLGDSFDDLAAAEALAETDRLWLTRLMAGRDWIWIAGNHDPAPLTLGGSHREIYRQAPLIFRHIATPETAGEISGHYHPKARLFARGRAISRPCFLVDQRRVILPAYGTYTGGLRSDTPELCQLMDDDAMAILLGPSVRPIPMPRLARESAPPGPAPAFGGGGEKRNGAAEPRRR